MVEVTGGWGHTLSAMVVVYLQQATSAHGLSCGPRRSSGIHSQR
jgi:hypothetical protein